jgi:hypothetical protein
MEEVAQVAAHRLVSGAFPGPVRRGVVDAHVERLASCGVSDDGVDRACRDQVGDVAGLRDGCLVLPQVGVPHAISMSEVVDPAAEDPEKFFVAALDRTVVREVTGVPLADQSRAITTALQQ